MKNFFSFITPKAMMVLMLFVFSTKTFARKIYPIKGSDNVVYIYGPTYAYAAGDTFVLKASNGPYNFMELISVYGTPANPIVVINEDGQVNITQFRIRNCRNLKVRGTGNSAFNYGFYMSSPYLYQPAFDITGRSANVEVNNVDINVMGYGFFIKQEAACEDSLQAPNWVIDNISVHDTRIQNINQEGFYAGSTAPNAERSIVCNGATIFPTPPRLSNIRIYNNIIDKTGRAGIQLSGAPFGNNEIYNNTISNAGTELNDWQGNGIVLGACTAAYVHDNTINNTLTSGIFSLGAGLVRIENNIINNSGSLNGKTIAYCPSIYVDTRLTNPLTPLQFNIKNNVLGTCTGGYQIRIYKGAYPYATNNILCNNTKNTGGAATLYIESGIAYTGCSATNQLPVVNAGSAQTITLPVALVNLAGTATDADGTIASYQWSQVSGPAPAIIASVGTVATAVTGLVAGTYVFKLTVTDNSGGSASSNISITVNAAIPPPTTQPVSAVRIEAENYTQMAGVQTETTSDVGGGLNVGWQDNNDWMDYSVNLAAAATYAVNFRVASYFSGAQFQLRKSDGTILTTVTVPNTTSFQKWQTVSANVALPAGQQTLRIITTNANGGWNINWWEIAGVATSGATNQAPTVNAGADQTIILPVSAVTLAGTAADADGSVSTYAWTLVSGPSTPVFTGSATATTQVSGLAQGSYVFRLTVTDNAGATATDDVIVTVNAASSTTQTTVKIEAESYSQMSGVQTESTSDIGGGLNVGWQDNNDWMDFPVNIAAAATYVVNFRVASFFTGARFQVRASDGSILATVTVPNTGSFQTWQTTSANITLPAGQQTLRLITTDANGGWNINWFEIAGTTTVAPVPTPTPSPVPTPAPSSARIEAEDYVTMSGVQTETTSDAGGGLNVGWQDTNDWMDYSVTTTAAATYTVNFRVASYFSGAQFQVRKSDGTVLATVTVPNTSSFQKWQTVSAQIALAAGTQTIRLFTNNANGGWNINWFEIGSASASKMASDGAVTEVTDGNNLSITSSTVADRLVLKISNALTGTAKIEFVNAAGETVRTVNVNKSATGTVQSYLSVRDLASGNYILRVTMNDVVKTVQFTKQ